VDFCSLASEIQKLKSCLLTALSNFLLLHVFVKFTKTKAEIPLWGHPSLTGSLIALQVQFEVNCCTPRMVQVSVGGNHNAIVREQFLTT
jgi:hypothetical protein